MKNTIFSTFTILMFLALLEGLSFSVLKLYSLGLEKKKNIKKDTKYFV